MNKCKKTISVFTFIFLFVSFLITPVNLVMADETSSEKTASDSKKDVNEKKKEKGKGKGKGEDEEDEEEPDCD
jgi:uncharacterized membrane protein